MSHTFHFKPEINFQCITDTIALLRENDLKKNKFAIVDHAMYLTGGVNAFLADRFQPDEPTPPSPDSPDKPFINEPKDEELHPFVAAASAAEDMSMEELMDQIEMEVRLIQEQQSFGALGPNGEAHDHAAIQGLNPMLAAFLRQLLQMVLDQLLS